MKIFEKNVNQIQSTTLACAIRNLYFKQLPSFKIKKVITKANLEYKQNQVKQTSKKKTAQSQLYKMRQSCTIHHKCNLHCFENIIPIFSCVFCDRRRNQKRKNVQISSGGLFGHFGMCCWSGSRYAHIG